MGRREDNYYLPIEQKLRQLFSNKVADAYLEITAEGFSNKLKSAIPANKDIIFSFLGSKGARPDITGYFSKEHSKEFFVVEIKNEKLTLDDIYQLKKYADLFDAWFAFLVSTEEIPAEIKRLSKAAPFLLWRTSPFPYLMLARYAEKEDEFAEWFEKNPFQQEIYWR